MGLLLVGVIGIVLVEVAFNCGALMDVALVVDTLMDVLPPAMSLHVVVAGECTLEFAECVCYLQKLLIVISAFALALALASLGRVDPSTFLSLLCLEL